MVAEIPFYCQVQTVNRPFAAAFLILTFWVQSARSDDLDFIPDGARVYLRINVDQVVASSVYKQLLSQRPKQAASLAAIIRDGTGIKHDEMRSFAIAGGFRRGERGDGVAIMRLKEPSSFDDIKRTKAVGKLRIESRNVGDYQMHTHTGGDSFALPQPNCLLISEDFSLEPILERGPGPRDIEHLRKTVAALDADKLAVAAISLADISDEERRILNKELSYLTGLIDLINDATLEVDAPDDIRLTLRFDCTSDDAAKTVESEIPARLRKLTAAPQCPPALAALLAETECEANGRVVQVTGHLPVEDAVGVLAPH